MKPVKRMVDRIRAVKPDAKIIGFPKGCVVPCYAGIPKENRR